MPEPDEGASAARVRELNDAFRQAPHARGKLCLTRAIAAKSLSAQLAILHRVMTFDAFTEDNDPYQEHNFGAFEYDGEKIFWRIDYYDLACEYGSDDPSDPAQTTRVMTIMLASEY
ncbi:Protein of unknown function [Rhodoblastus acidophilus]|uniref:DUF3768 domain-containing protein n=1 Tax=Rhodoblastus acidophilus TaxID=1074 RepID=A0A212SCY6_RHOAC|nr:DUF3768 domain-containing protein [Rhodoblastus acidophilus]PPQ35568.1 DUF3768 domain-containing protein [Rhodoblastus acidophilus]RAI17007.1 DUF3768 domain-containing protein [Rhodoblastus acidophilus]SNB83435.1 Protein of unknown function [Rhodoblastus acidophilus]